VAALDFLKMAVNRCVLPQHQALHKKKFTKVLQKMKASNLKLPESIITNAYAQKYLC